MTILEDKKKQLLEIIKKEAIVYSKDNKIIKTNGEAEKAGWLIDMRNIFLAPRALELIVEIFWNLFEKEYPFQVGGQEIAAIPLVSAIVLHSQKIGKPVNGFIIRKSRKPTGLQKIIEGKINNEKIILVDDLMHSGETILRQLEVLKKTNNKIQSVFILVSYLPQKNNELLLKRNIPLHFVYQLKDLGLNMAEGKKYPSQGFDIVWKFSSPDPAFFHRVHKSTPIIDEKKIYIGTDNSCFWALNKKDGSVCWKFDSFGYPTRDGKIIFSSPIASHDTVFFGAYDGNVYALNKETGTLRWKYMDADHVGSSPAFSQDLGLIFIGLEFGLFKKRGGIVALNARTGKRLWQYTMTDFVHCSPAYCPEKKIVAIGGNDSCVYLFNAKNGDLRWKFLTGGEVKSSLTFDVKRNLLLFGSLDKNLYALDIDSGKIRGKFTTREPIYSTPLIYNENVYFGSLDKHLYCFNLDTGKFNWSLDCKGRIFARPKIIASKLYIGSTAGFFYEINPKNGLPESFFISTERITNEVVYDEKNDLFYLPTYANEIYCLKKKPPEK